MSENTDRLLGEVIGELRSLTGAFNSYQVAHDTRHREIDEKIDQHAADINQAKGAKGALLAVGAAVAGLVSLAVAAANHLLK